MKDMKKKPFNRESLTEDILHEWQHMLNDVADIFGVPAGLITRVDGNEIEILLSSETEGNPYPANYTSQYPDSGWYCEHTLKSRGLNLIPDALQDPQWKDNAAAVGMHMVSYLGMPINYPDGGQFGTVCFIDNKQNAHNELHIKVVEQIKRMVELTLRIILAQKEISSRDRLLHDLSKIYPICCYCKKIKEDTGEWVSVEQYVRDISGAMASHGICPQCYEKEIKQFT